MHTYWIRVTTCNYVQQTTTLTSHNNIQYVINYWVWLITNTNSARTFTACVMVQCLNYITTNFNAKIFFKKKKWVMSSIAIKD